MSAQGGTDGGPLSVAKHVDEVQSAATSGSSVPLSTRGQER